VAATRGAMLRQHQERGQVTAPSHERGQNKGRRTGKGLKVSLSCEEKKGKEENKEITLERKMVGLCKWLKRSTGPRGKGSLWARLYLDAEKASWPAKG